MDLYAQAASQIIKEQQAIIGPIAVDQAKKVEGLEVVTADDVKITGVKKDVLGALVNQYAQLFGQASVEVCKEAFSHFSDKIPTGEIPDILKS
jgi:hypothetical protein